MTRTLHSDELVFDAGLGKLGVHILGERVRHVGVVGPVNQDGGRILGRDVPDGTVAVEPFAIGVGVVSGDFFGPETILPAIQVKPRRAGYLAEDPTQAVLPTAA